MCIDLIASSRGAKVRAKTEGNKNKTVLITLDLDFLVREQLYFWLRDIPHENSQKTEN